MLPGVFAVVLRKGCISKGRALEKVAGYWRGFIFLVGSWNEANEQSDYIMEMTLFLCWSVLKRRNNDRLLTKVLKGPKRAEVIKIHVVLCLHYDEFIQLLCFVALACVLSMYVDFPHSIRLVVVTGLKLCIQLETRRRPWTEKTCVLYTNL